MRYEVVGMRPGPDTGTTVFATTGPTANATVEPAAASPTDAASAAGGSGGAVTRDGSGVPTGNGVTSVHREVAAPGSHTTTTADSGFDEHLPFKPRSGQAGGSSIADLTGDRGSGATRQHAVLIGGGSLALSWAMLLRFLSRRALVY
jgi:hypothetical protein